METPAYALSLTAAAAAIASRRLTPRALADVQLARIDATDGRIEAWVALDPARVRAEADRCINAVGPLAGIGIAVKDIIATRALPTQMGSPAFDGHRPERDAAVVTRLTDAGGYVFAKTVTTELAFLHPSRTRNPWHDAHTPGGSSSGSAAAVAAGHVCGALGTQTNGSVIRPAAFCGVVGFKPTLGAIPFDGVNVFSETLDTVGTFTRTVADAAVLASALSASPSTMRLFDLASAPRLACLARFPWSEIDEDATAALDATLARLREHGATVTMVPLPDSLGDTCDIHRTIMLSEGARNLAPLQARARAQLSQTLNAALDAGRAFSDADYRNALDARQRAIATLMQAFAGFDAVLTPSARGEAPRGLAATGDPSCCTLWSLAGFPAITIPIAVGRSGLPLAMQLGAPAHRDGALLSVAQWCERAIGFGALVERT